MLILLLYNSLINKKLLLSYLYFRQNVASYIFVGGAKTIVSNEAKANPINLTDMPYDAGQAQTINIYLHSAAYGYIL